MKLFILSTLLFVISGIVPVHLHAEENWKTSDKERDFNPLSVEKLWEMKRIGSPVISPNGDWVIAPVTRYTVEDDKSHTDIWLFKTDGSVERPLTTHGSADGQPTFSPDGSRLAFVTRRDGDDASQIYILPMDEPGEAIRLTEVPTGVSAPKWVGEHIYFISRIFPDMEWDEMSEKLKERRDSHMSAHTWNAMPYSFWDHWIDEEREAHLFRIPAEGGETENITGPTGWQLPRSVQGAGNYDVAPDESLVAFNANSTRDETNVNMDLFLAEPGSSEARNITPNNEAPDTSPVFSPDGSLLAYTSQRIKGFYADTRRLVLYNIADGSHNEVTANWDRSSDGLVWNPDGSGLFGAIDDAGTRRVYSIPVDGSVPRAITTDTDFPSIDVSGNGVLVALNHSFLYPPRIVRVDTSTGETSRLDTINDDILDEADLGTYESVTYEGANGQEIQMWVHYPPGFDESREYPLFLLIHGGPHSGITDGFHFRWNAQTFASWGYVTAWHNFHGSSGFGQDFTDSINPDWLTLPYEDTIKAAEWFANQSWIDADRMVAGGGSYGGYLSSILLAKEHPFNALVIHAPVYNMYSQMAADFAVHSERFGDYWEVPEIYESISPHYFAEDFSTPALIIHGQMDYRVPVGQAFELFRTLQTKGIDSRLIYYPDENHWILKPNNSIYWYNQVKKWVEEYAPPAFIR
ncbi:MAG: S9 family peptidase [Balneolaceae bacterium]|nr:MAG: S9 family peptidase [Balneolaceae bacterium]